jgi:hypothetical protein
VHVTSFRGNDVNGNKTSASMIRGDDRDDGDSSDHQNEMGSSFRVSVTMMDKARPSNLWSVRQKATPFLGVACLKCSICTWYALMRPQRKVCSASRKRPATLSKLSLTADTHVFTMTKIRHPASHSTHVIAVRRKCSTSTSTSTQNTL